MLSKTIVSIIFRLVNFIVFAGLVAYLFKKYALPQIKEKLAEKYAFFRDLENKRKNLINQNQIAKKEIKDQDNLFELLKKKLAGWNKSCDQKNKEKEKELDIIIQYHKKRLEIQTQNMQQQKLLKEVFPRVIAGTYKQLQEKFSKKQESEKFLKDIIEYMKKSVE